MIKINLLSEGGSRRRKGSVADRKLISMALVAYAAMGVLVFLFVHRPAAAEVENIEAANAELKKQNDAVAKQTKDLSKVQAAVKSAKEKEKAIEQLRAAKTTPAWFLREMSRILTPGHQPSLTDAMRKRVEADPNRGWSPNWDPKNVWITSFVEKDGEFVMKGAGASHSDMAQLALRLQASMFFKRVTPQGGAEKKIEDASSQYEFEISGEVRY